MIYFPFDILVDPSQPDPDSSTKDAPAGQSEELCLYADTADAVRATFTTPATPRCDDDIQLVEPPGTDSSGDTVMTQDTQGVSSLSLLLILLC